MSLQPNNNSPLPSLELFVQVIDTNATGIIIIDENKKIIFWNKWIEKTSGISKDKAMAKNIISLFPELKASRIDKAVELSITKGNASFISHAFNKKMLPLYSLGNKNKPLRQVIHIKPLLLEETKRYCFLQVNDSSNAFYREQQLRKMAREANSLSKLKSGFVSTVSHELRTPLTSIMGAIGLIKAGVEDPSSDTFKQMIDVAYSNADRLLLLISDILDIEKIESGNMDFTLSRENMNDLIESCLEHNAGLAKKYHVTFNFIKSTEMPLINIDKNRINQVLNNLLSNAAKFEPNNGTINIETTLEKNNVIVSITDHGSGIPVDFRDKIFQRFTQADISNTKNVSGTGLGLAITKHIIEQHNGKINFESESNVITRFYFSLPITG